MLFEIGRRLLAGEAGGKKRYRLLVLAPNSWPGKSLLDLAGGQDTRRDSLEAAIDVEARLGKDRYRAAACSAASTGQNATPHAGAPP